MKLLQTKEFSDKYVDGLYLNVKRISQDHVESYFSAQRQMCGGTQNMTGYTYGYNHASQGLLPTPGAATKTLVQAGHVTLSKIFCSVWWGKYQITCFHIQAIHFKCKERDVMIAKNNINFLI